MSRLTRIETALRAVDGARFHQLCDAYLAHRGYRMNPFGRAVGADKVKRGTPDSWALLPNGRYLFAEYTTQRTGLLDKLRGDLAKCLDPARTGVPIPQLQEVELFHTGVLSPGEEDMLVRDGQACGVRVTQTGIGPLAFDILQKYPGLARDYLEVEIDTGQIVSPEEFVSLYGRSAVATPLDIGFHFRADEVEQVLAALTAGNFVILSGRTGVGKSRLALECARRFALAHPETRVHCIYDRGVDLFEDVRVHFSGPGAHLVLVDDANRLGGFGHVLHLLRDPAPGRTVRILSTVRDYALATVREAALPYGGGTEVTVRPLAEMEIETLVRHAFGIDDLPLLNRITELSGGYPRLAPQ
jgi:hypothetical protein